ncbi:hypothetical protein [Ruegeria arenilitoris]|uniref:hypothetical protein n=1 Tax=Ruegeria arenilitoris TaxID=1173585 RepID=UPI00147F8CC3|nr:hypothetical protein [Ruegeria arenilitoris]
MESILIASFFVFVVALVGHRARNPSPAELSLIADPQSRPNTVGLYLLHGLSTFIHPSANETVAFSRRYDATPFTLKTAAWAIGLSSGFVTSAIYLGWAMFDITTIGEWSFFKPDVPEGKRWFQTAVSVVPMILLVVAAADRDTISERFPDAVKPHYDFIVIVSFFAFVVLHMIYFGNNGLLTLSIPLVMLFPSERLMALLGITCAYAGVALGYLGETSATQGAMVVFILIVAVVTWLAFVATVEILSALRWYDSGGAMILVGMIGSVAIGLMLALIAPIVMVFVLFAIMTTTPEQVHSDWVNIVGVFREGGTQAAVMLGIACIPPLLPGLWFLGRGLGTLIARNTPMMPRFIKSLETVQGRLTQSQMDDMMRPYRRAYTVGFTAASVLVLTLFAAEFWLLVNLLTAAG